VRIHILQLLAVLALACIPLDSQKTYAAATAAKPAFVFGGVSYLHRWSQNDQHEFTPEGQEDLEKWSDMITMNAYPSAHDGDALAAKANAVLENYKSHGDRMLRTTPYLGHRISPRSISSPWCSAAQTLLRWRLRALS
jgi:hypothetical protein